MVMGSSLLLLMFLLLPGPGGLLWEVN